MTNSKTKQPTTTFEDYTDNEVFYNTAKEDLMEAVHNNKKIIMLIGSGGNGKSYLTNELYDFLNINNYSVNHDNINMCNDAESFNTILESTNEKILAYFKNYAGDKKSCDDGNIHDDDENYGINCAILIRSI